ncbi:MAG TPA: dipeptidase [Bacteroidales bacterium]|nr:dipeptidase [Bacteroidales bacterium]
MNNYIEANKDRFLNELFDFIRIPSVSAKPENKQDMYAAAEFLKNKLLEAGVDFAEVNETAGHPVVYAEKMIDPKLPTVMVYGHYDVQPAEPLELWHSKPFEPEVRDGKIWARGADDDKGQLYMQVKAFELMNKTGNLACNIKFMVEGEEEVGSMNLGDYCKANKVKLKSDVIVVSDTTIIANDTPSITTGLRGLSYVQVEVTGPNRDLHSGLYGGAIVNPANALAKMIAKLHDDNYKITIPGFYDDVVEISREERDLMALAPFNLENYKKSLDIDAVKGETGYLPKEHTGIRPCLDVNGMWSGYTGEGAKTILPSKAFAKISMRLVPNQDPEIISRLISEYLTKIAPEGVRVKVEYLHGGNAYVSPVDIAAYKAAEFAMEKTFGKQPIPVRSGGSIPIIALFEKELEVKSILMGFGLESDAIHSPNENYPLFNFYKGIETIPYFFNKFSKTAFV